jgi:hypothetical protein
MIERSGRSGRSSNYETEDDTDAYQEALRAGSQDEAINEEEFDQYSRH